MPNDAVQLVHDSARLAAYSAKGPLVLAVSGGIDSMVMLSAMHDVAAGCIAAVATFDHGTGLHSTVATEHVLATASTLGLRGVVGQAERLDFANGREAAWRNARHQFLARVARPLSAQVATAHTEDDQVETVLMRVLRQSGARGLAGLYATSDRLHPFLELRRTTLEAYARERGVRWVDDPSNSSREFLRNRVRHDLLPALKRRDATLDTVLLAISRRAQHWRADVEAFVTNQIAPKIDAEGRLIVSRTELAGYNEDSLQVLWAAVAGRLGLALDARGTRRLAEFTMSGQSSGRMPLAGGWCLEATRSAYILGRPEVAEVPASMLPSRGSLTWGRFRFHAMQVGTEMNASPWAAVFSAAEGPIFVRTWADGDRLAPNSTGARRRVKRYLSDVGLQGSERAGWPVVVAGNDVVWIPGIRRSDAATDRSGRPVRHYLCERIDR